MGRRRKAAATVIINGRGTQSFRLSNNRRKITDIFLLLDEGVLGFWGFGEIGRAHV